MTPKKFLDNFATLADTPNGVGKLRELVLRLAVRGKLVPQDPKDEPAENLLKRIQVHKRDHVRKHGLKRIRKLVTVEECKQPFPAPGKWIWCCLGDLARSQAGFAFKSRLFNEDKAGMPLIRIRDILHSATQVFYSGDYRDEFIVQAGDYLIGMDGNFNVAVWRGPNALLNQRVTRLQWYSPDLGRPFVGHALQHRLLELQGKKAYTTVDHLSGKQIEESPIPLPPLNEQHRIVAKVDQLMSLCDELEEKGKERVSVRVAAGAAAIDKLLTARDDQAFAKHWTRVRDHFDSLYDTPKTVTQLRQAILQLAVQGKLVPQNPNDEPAAELLKREFTLPSGYKRKRKIVKKTPVNAPEDLFVTLPDSWAYVVIQDLYDRNVIIDYADGNHGSLYPRKHEFGDTGETFVSAKDIVHGRVVWDGCSKLNQEKAKQLTKGWSQGGDVLLTHNATVGRVARVEPDAGRFLLGTSVTFYRLAEQAIDAGYFYIMLMSRVWQGQLEAIMSQTTRNQVSIQKQAFFQIPLPPQAEQRRIVAKADQLLSLCDALEEELKRSEVDGEALMAAAVHGLLNGASGAGVGAA